MARTIVTHIHPDLDAIAASWLLVRFDQPRYGDAKIVFVAAGETYKGELVDSDNEITHVDTGRGAFDHHQPGVLKTCATKLVHDHLVNSGLIDEDNKPLQELVELVRQIDNFEDLYWPESAEMRNYLMLHEIVPALHSLQIHDDEAVLRLVFVYLDATLQKLKEVAHGRELIEDAPKFESVWGSGIVVSGEVDDLSKLAMKMGYKIVITYNERKKYLKVKTAPRVERNLKDLYDRISKIDGPDSWFYHNSGHIILTGSDKGPAKVQTQLTVDKLLELITESK